MVSRNFAALPAVGRVVRAYTVNQRFVCALAGASGGEFR